MAFRPTLNLKCPHSPPLTSNPLHIPMVEPPRAMLSWSFLSQVANSMCVWEKYEVKEIVHEIGNFKLLPLLPTMELASGLKGG